MSVHLVPDTDIRLGAQPAVRAGYRDELRALLATRLDNACTPYSFAPYGGSRCDTIRSRPRNAAQFSRSTPLDDVQLWFTRSDDGLALRTRFPNPVARPVVTEFLDRVADILTTAVRPG